MIANARKTFLPILFWLCSSVIIRVEYYNNNHIYMNGIQWLRGKGEGSKYPEPSLDLIDIANKKIIFYK